MPDSSVLKYVYQSPDYLVRETDHGKILQRTDDPTTVLTRLQPDDPDHLAEYIKRMLLPLAFIDMPRKAILIGLGGGTMVRFIRRWVPEVHLTALEIVPEVVDLARTYFDLPADDERLQVVVGDGAQYMLSYPAEGDVDLILSDAYGEQNCVVDALHTPEFYKACYRALRPGGVMTINIYKPTPEWGSAYMQMLTDIFSDTHFDIVAPDQGVMSLWKEGPTLKWENVLRSATRLDAGLKAGSTDSTTFVGLAKTLAEQFKSC